jgi:hypothetical protein
LLSRSISFMDSSLFPTAKSNATEALSICYLGNIVMLKDCGLYLRS